MNNYHTYNNEIVTFIGEVAVHNMPGTPEAHHLYKSKNGYFALSINDALTLTSPIGEYPVIKNLTDIHKIEQIILMIEMHFGKRSKWLSKSRKREYIYPRHLLFWAARKSTSQTLTDISDNFGFDHATVIHAIKNVTTLLEVGNEAVTECAQAIAVSLSESRDNTLVDIISKIKEKSVFINKEKVDFYK